MVGSLPNQWNHLGTNHISHINSSPENIKNPRIVSHPHLPPSSHSSHTHLCSQQSGDCHKHVSDQISIDYIPFPPKGHKRSNSDIPFRYSTEIHSSNPESLHHKDGADKGTNEWLGKRKSEEDVVVDDLLTSYMNLDNFNTLNLSCIDNDMDSESAVTNNIVAVNNENQAEIFMGSTNGVKRRQHSRSVSMDSFMGSMNFSDDLLKPPPSPISANRCVDFSNREFNASDLDKISSNGKLSEIASSDPKRAKRILANRLSAARSKERKTQYISELEHKVQILETEATTLSSQITLFQRDFSASTSQNKELKLRVDGLEQQAQLRDDLNRALMVEVQHLRLAAADLNASIPIFQTE